jgi:hypothetical protein
VSEAPKLPWLEDLEFFKQRLATGEKWQVYVTNLLWEEGILATTEIATNEPLVYDDRHPEEYADQCDLDVGGHKIEVKSLGLTFTGPDDWPFGVAFVDTVRSWDKKVTPRLAVVNVSQKTGGITVIPVASTRATWTVTRRWDSARGFNDDFYQVRKGQLRSFADLVRYLRSNPTRREGC